MNNNHNIPKHEIEKVARDIALAYGQQGGVIKLESFLKEPNPPLLREDVNVIKDLIRTIKRMKHQ